MILRFAATLAALLLALAARPAEAITTHALLDSIQRTAFLYFWNEANPSNGLIRDRNQGWSPASIAAQGFGLSAICIGVDHGWVTRAAARQRVRTALQTYFNGPQGTTAGNGSTIGYKGLFYHFLHMNTARREWTSELSTIDTALLMAGVLDAMQYFDDPADPDEIQIRWLADTLYKRVDWNWARNGSQAIRHGWNPESGGQFLPHEWVGYNEAMILYILALGSPTHPPANGISAWRRWDDGYVWGTQYGQTYVLFPPLFGHQYSHCWVDFRYIQDEYMRRPDRGIDYFENSRRATYAARQYCIANPLGRAGYSGVEWGLTAGDGPAGYAARGAPPSQNDDGTITATAAISSLPFAPEIVIPTIHHFWDQYGPVMWGPYGFNDGWNLGQLWWGPDVIGIDQGPIIIMIENYLTGRVWSRFMAHPYVQTGLQRAGFLTNTAGVDPAATRAGLALSAGPNPFGDRATVRFSLPAPGPVRLAAFDVQGREVAQLASGVLAAGDHAIEWRTPERGGVYFLKLEHGGRSAVTRCVRTP